MAFGDVRGTKTGSATSITASFACATGTNFAVVADDLIVALLSEQTSVTTTACADNLGNTYTPLGAGLDAGTVTGRGFYSRVTNAGTITTVTFTATASANNCVGLAVGFEGPFATSPVDAAPAGIVNDNTTPYTCPATGTLAQADEKIVCAIIHNGNPTFTATSPNAIAVQLNTATVLKAAIGHQTVSSTASVAPAWTSSATPTASAYDTVSFKRAALVPIDGTGTLAAQAAAIVTSPVGISGSTGVGVLPAPGVGEEGAPALDLDFASDTITEAVAAAPYFATLVGVGTVGWVSEGTGDLDAGTAAIAGAGITEGVGTGVLVAQASALAGAGTTSSTGTGILAAQAATLTGAAKAEHIGTGVLAADSATLTGAGTVATAETTGTGTLATGSAALAGAGTIAGVGTGVLVAQAAAISGAGVSGSVGVGVLPAPGVSAEGPTLDLDFAGDTITEAGEGPSDYVATLVGVGTVGAADVITGTGVLTPTAATLTATGTVAGVGTGVLVAQASTLAGAGTSASTGTGTLAAQAAAVVGSGDVAAVVTSGTGALVAQTSALVGAGFLASTGTGVLVPEPAIIVGIGSAFGAGTGVLPAQAASLAAVGVSSSTGTGVLVCSSATILGQGTVGDVAPVDLFPPHGLPFLATVGQMMSRL